MSRGHDFFDFFPAILPVSDHWSKFSVSEQDNDCYESYVLIVAIRTLSRFLKNQT